jgi:hypothetical protein
VTNLLFKMALEARKAAEIDLKGYVVAHFEANIDAVLTRIARLDMVHRDEFGPARLFRRRTLGPVARLSRAGEKTRRLDTPTNRWLAVDVGARKAARIDHQGCVVAHFEAKIGAVPTCIARLDMARRNKFGPARLYRRRTFAAWLCVKPARRQNDAAA